MKKIQYIWIAIGLMATMASCNLDVKMYDGVMMEDFDPRNIQDLSQGSYRLLFPELRR